MFVQAITGWQVDREIEFVLITDNEVDAGLFLQPFRARLGVAAGDGNKGFRGMLQRLANEIPGSPLSVFRHRAGVQHQQVCWLAKWHEAIAILPQSFAEHGGFRLVEPTAQRMQ